MTILILGGTGTLGRQIVRQALEKGFPVRCIVRNRQAANFLNEWGAELVYGDLTLPETLPLSFKGVTAVIDASTTRSDDNSNILDVDWYGKLMLIEMAKLTQIKRFIFFSILNAENHPNILLMQQKYNIEKVLIHSGVPYTIFSCAGFYQALIPQYAIPVLEGKSVWKTSESFSMFYIDSQDAAKLCIKSLFLKQTENKKLFLGGVQAWSSNAIIQFCETLSGQKAEIKIIPLFILKLLREITSFFDWTSKISQRLDFIEIYKNQTNSVLGESLDCKLLKITSYDLNSLEDYFREYFEMMLVNLENLDFESQKKQKDLIL